MLGLKLNHVSKSNLEAVKHRFSVVYITLKFSHFPDSTAVAPAQLCNHTKSRDPETSRELEGNSLYSLVNRGWMCFLYLNRWISFFNKILLKTSDYFIFILLEADFRCPMFTRDICESFLIRTFRNLYMYICQINNGVFGLNGCWAPIW